MSDADTSRPADCRACGGAEMFGPLRLYPETGMGEGSILVSTMRSNPLRSPRATAIAAWVCRTCGHLDLFTTEPEKLHEFWAAQTH